MKTNYSKLEETNVILQKNNDRFKSELKKAEDKVKHFE